MGLENTLYPTEIKTALKVCQHYRDVVSRTQTSDIHDRNKHTGALNRRIAECGNWLAVTHGSTGADLREAQILSSHCKSSIGAAIIWLESVAQT